MLTTINARRVGRNDMSLRAKPNEGLTLEEMQASLPAIFAPQPHASRSDRYVYISTRDVLGELIKHDFVPVEARVSRSRDEDRQDFAKHLVRLRQRGDLEAFKPSEWRVGDTSFEVVLRNAHDGTGSYQFMAGILRLICLNGCVVSDGDLASVKVLHTGNRERQLGQVIEGAYTVLDQGPRVMDQIRSWQQIELNRDEQMAFAEAAHTARFADADGNVNTAIKPEQLLVARRPLDTGNDLWRTFNRIQENAVRGGLSAMGRDANGRPRRSTTREVRGIDGDVKLNRALWQLTSKMAQLKTA